MCMQPVTVSDFSLVFLRIMYMNALQIIFSCITTLVGILVFTNKVQIDF